MTVPLYPQVPNVPGVPALLRLASTAIPLPLLAAADMLGLQGLLGAPQWGIFSKDGSAALIADAVASVGQQRDFEITNAPVEAGSFASYNKVARPYRSRVTLLKGGVDAFKSDFLTALDAIVADLNVYMVVTPEYTYANANVVHYDYSRSQRQGASLLTVDVWLEEVRPIATTVYTSPASPNGAGTTQGGSFLPVPVTSTTLPPINAARAH